MSEVADESVVPTLEGLRRLVREQLEPMRAELIQIERLIAVKQQEISELRELKREIDRVLNAADRDGSSKPGPKPGVKRRVGDQRVTELIDWLRENFSTEDDLTRRLIREQWPIEMAPDSIARCIEKAVERGALRLDHLLRGQGTPTKVYRLT